MLRPITTAINDLLDHCARIESGQRVLVVAARDGLSGGANLVDEQAVNSIQDGVRQRGGHPSLLWVDLQSRPHAWKVPPVIKAALSETDLFINHAFDLPFEELYEMRETLAKNRVPMIRNMATTAPLLESDWAQTPYELVSEIRFQTASMFRQGLPWSLIHPNGTQLKGSIGAPLRPFMKYNERRSEGFYRPFPEGVFTPISPMNTEGVLIFDRTLTWWARFVGVPPQFTEPVIATIERNRVRQFEGGEEARAFRRFFATMADRLGGTVYDVPGLHGGVHPWAHVAPDRCPHAGYREFIEHHHSTSVHLHLGAGPQNAEYPYMLHVTAELRGATLKVGDHVIYDRGRLTALDHPEVQAVAGRYPDRPSLPPS
jgi:hypothetical protein